MIRKYHKAPILLLRLLLLLLLLLLVLVLLLLLLLLAFVIGFGLTGFGLTWRRAPSRRTRTYLFDQTSNTTIRATLISDPPRGFLLLTTEAGARRAAESAG